MTTERRHSDDRMTRSRPSPLSSSLGYLAQHVCPTAWLWFRCDRHKAPCSHLSKIYNAVTLLKRPKGYTMRPTKKSFTMERISLKIDLWMACEPCIWGKSMYTALALTRLHCTSMSQSHVVFRELKEGLFISVSLFQSVALLVTRKKKTKKLGSI